MAESRELGDEEKRLAAESDRLRDDIRTTLLTVPNVPSPDAPDGASEADNRVLRTEGYDPAAYGDHQRVPHWDIGAELGILDGERAAKISGSMFTMYRGWGARLLRALVQLSLDRNADAYEEIRPPTLVLTDTMVATGHLPKFVDEAYHLERDDLWAIPTAEVPLTSLHRDEILAEADLPRRYMAHTSCFRREAGAAGKDTRGLLRVHEFDKVELLAVAAGPAQAIACQEHVLARSESLLADLGLAYRVLDLCTGDLGASAARTWDIEAYASGVDAWLEVSSVSWFGDYQARRASVRYRPADGTGTAVCHTVNGSAMGWPRTVAAYLETHRRPDGTVAVVDVLRPYLGGADHIPHRTA
jgi:seryl-tRNA synthetase